MPGGSGAGDRGRGAALLWKAHRQGRADRRRAHRCRAARPSLPWPIHRCDRRLLPPGGGLSRQRPRAPAREIRNGPRRRRGDPGRRDLHQRALTPLFDPPLRRSYNVSPSFGWRAFDVVQHLRPYVPGHDLRREPDQVRILSGTFIDPASGTEVTLGTPIALVIDNVDARSKDYEAIAETYRPGHADYTYDVKYGLRDPRGSGRASARETAARVAAGAVARKIVPSMKVRGALVQMGEIEIDRNAWDWDEISRNPFFCPDAKAAKKMEDYLDRIRKKGSSIGAVIEVIAEDVPPGLGSPVYGKLDAELAGALMGINAVKGVEIGAGFAAALFTGEENADE